ncbi:protein disulfide isomerase (PDI) protein [Phlyctochytrium bullatum]|nr:protein disulfide isomerase (PDI) protein [Phlyctochytrium bullatum]
MHLTAGLLVLSSLLTTAVALYSSRDAVIQITPANFKKEVLETKHAVIAEFYAPWCGHCKNLAPEYKKAAEKLRGLAKVVAIDCDAHRDLCGRYGIQGFPTLKVFGSDKKNVQDYTGPRTAKGIVDAVIPKIPSFVQLVGTKGKAKALDDFLGEGDLNKVILVSQKDRTPPLFKALSAEFYKRLTFGEVRSSDSATTEKLNVTKYPAVIVFGKDDKKATVFEGEMKHASLIEFLSKYSAKIAAKDTKKAGEKQEKPKEEEKPAVFDPKIPEISTEDLLQEHCLKLPGVCILSFHSLEAEYPESVEAHKQEIEVLTTVKKTFFEKKGPYSFAWINIVKHGKNLVKQFDVSDSVPAVLAINSKKGVYVNYRGAFDAASLTSFLTDLQRGKARTSKFSFVPALDGSIPKHTEL